MHFRIHYHKEQIKIHHNIQIIQLLLQIIQINHLLNKEWTKYQCHLQ